MSNWGLAQAGLVKGNERVSVNSSATAHTKSAWVQMSSAAPLGVQAIEIVRTEGASLRFFLDIAVGGSGSEFVVAENIAFTVSDQYRSGAWACVLPFAIPPGVRVAFRVQSDSTSRSGMFALSFIVGGGLYPVGGGAIQTYGAVTATTDGTSVVGGFTNYGTSVEFVSATALPVRAVAVQMVGAGVGNGGNSRARVLVGTQDIGAVWGFSQYFTEGQYGGVGPVFVPCSIPVGAQINVQHADDYNVGATRKFILYTVS